MTFNMPLLVYNIVPCLLCTLSLVSLLFSVRTACHSERHSVTYEIPTSYVHVYIETIWNTNSNVIGGQVLCQWGTKYKTPSSQVFSLLNTFSAHFTDCLLTYLLLSTLNEWFNKVSFSQLINVRISYMHNTLYAVTCKLFTRTHQEMR